LRAEWIAGPQGDRSFPIERQLIHLRVTAWRERGKATSVAPVRTVRTVFDTRAAANG
jgi:hypothetical protein